MAALAVRLIVTGRVQGVGFRAWTRREALDRGLRGWVRNRLDGSVEALLIGAAEAVEAMIEAAGEGPSLARVEGLSPYPADDDGSTGFSERATV